MAEIIRMWHWHECYCCLDLLPDPCRCEAGPKGIAFCNDCEMLMEEEELNDG